MNTEQNYGGKGDSANHPTPAAQNAAQSHPSSYGRRDSDVVFTSGNTISINSEFGANLIDPFFVSNLRQDVRAWFVAYIPVIDASLSHNDLDASVHNYDMLDDFFSTLIEEGMKRMEGKSNA